MPTPAQLAPDEYYTYYATYLDYVPEGLSIPEALEDSLDAFAEVVAGFAEAQASYAYAPGKWTVAQALQHVIDTERVFGYRALVFARGDAGPLPGFDQDAFAATAGQPTRGLDWLIEEFSYVRWATMMLFAGFDEAALSRRGTMSGHVHSVRALGYICAGHVYHHAALYRERYGG